MPIITLLNPNSEIADSTEKTKEKTFWMLGKCRIDSYQTLNTQNQILYQFHSLPNPNTKPNSSL